MAYNNQEIELKLPLTKVQHQRTKDKLTRIAKFVNFSHHVDDYFTPLRNSFLEAKYPFRWLTIRKRDGKTLLNYKHWYPENTKYTTHCDEYETEVSSSDQIENILRSLGFKKFITVEKKRSVFSFKDELEISLDEVKKLGYFIEIEVVKDFGNLDRARSNILSFSRRLGFKRTRTVPGGYAAELMRKKGVLKFRRSK